MPEARLQRTRESYAPVIDRLRYVEPAATQMQAERDRVLVQFLRDWGEYRVVTSPQGDGAGE